MRHIENIVKPSEEYASFVVDFVLENAEKFFAEFLLFNAVMVV